MSKWHGNLSPSSLIEYLNCSMRWFYRRILELEAPRNAALLLGSAIHDAMAANFAQKVDSYVDLPPADVVGVFAESWSQMLPETEFRSDESPLRIFDQGKLLVLHFLGRVAPSIQPAAVELETSGHVGEIYVRSRLDILDITGRVIDLKSAAQTPNGIPPYYRLQVSTYVILTPEASGQAALVTITKNRRMRISAQAFEIGPDDHTAVQRIYPAVGRAIEDGTFLPHRGSLLCSRRYCPFWERCEKDWGGRVRD